MFEPGDYAKQQRQLEGEYVCIRVAAEPDERIPGADVARVYEMSESPVRGGIPCMPEVKNGPQKSRWRGLGESVPPLD